MPPLCVSPVAVSVSISVTESQRPPMPMLRPCCYGGSSADRDGSLPADADTTVWSVADAAELYRVDGWGAPYFAVNDFGNVFVRPHGDGTLPSQEIDLTKVVRKVVSGKSSGGLGMRAPFIVRFPDILRHRLESLQAAFDSAMALLGYEARYQGVYPVKCNQDRYVVENVVEFGAAHDFGLEAGSKPELLLAMASMCKASSPKALLICNGYKDAEYITLALTARRLGFNCVIVLEQDEELELVLDVARRLRVEPVIGVRAKLRTRHGGHFGGTSGENGKFGLTTAQIVGVVRRLKHAGMVNCLQLLHFHIGSQIPTVELLADGVTEAAFIYCELVRMGAAMNILDIGGGLGIDYDGTRSASSDMSVAYTLDEYAAAVVGAVQAACRHRGVESPVICSESGRALVSHHSVLLFDVVSLSEHGVEIPSPEEALADLPAELLDDYRTVVGFAGIGEYGQSRALAEKLKLRCVERFKEGELGLEQLALVDCINELLTNSPVRAVCQINLSIFKSLPDWWAIGQMFPLMPIQRLNERPTVRAVLSDLTCDSDGKLSRFIDGEDGLAVHRLNRRGGEPYYIGMFLGGAYQEALGGSHNLFGSPSVVHVLESEGPHGFAVTRALPGQTAADVLRLMMHEPHLMFQTLKCRIESSILGSSNRDSDSWSYATALSSLDSIAAAFDSLPYLSSSSSSASTSDGDDEESDDADALDFNLDLLW